MNRKLLPALVFSITLLPGFAFGDELTQII